MRLRPREGEQWNTSRLHRSRLPHFLVLPPILEAHLVSCGERECLETIRTEAGRVTRVSRLRGHVDLWKPMDNTDPCRARPPLIRLESNQAVWARHMCVDGTVKFT